MLEKNLPPSSSPLSESTKLAKAFFQEKPSSLEKTPGVSEKIEQFESRKLDHLRLALESKHQATGLSGMEGIKLLHEALPDVNWEDLRIECFSLGQNQQTPFYLSGMTAGHEAGLKLNEIFAQACVRKGWALGIGSQRRELFDPEQAKREWSTFREKFPTLTLFANLGISQLIRTPLDLVASIVETVKADALVIHLNALQECLQGEGTPQFKGGSVAIARLCEVLKVPVLVKETGCGMSATTISKLQKCGVAAVDVSGLGGTHWGRIEGTRSQTEIHSHKAWAAETFKNWGISTARSLEAGREIRKNSSLEIWASGGLRSGLDSAKAIAMGATRVGFAQPALTAALQGLDDLERWMDQIIFEFKIAMLCTGSSEPKELAGKWYFEKRENS